MNDRRRLVLLSIAAIVGGSVGALVGALAGDVLDASLRAGELPDTAAGLMPVLVGAVLGAAALGFASVAAVRVILREPGGRDEKRRQQQPDPPDIA